MLEGGYDLGALSGSMAALMPVLVSAADVGAPELGIDPLAAAARERLGLA